MQTSNIPPISEIERIAGMPDPVLRNLQITQCYHELALVLAERTGGDANWCNFATWASKQAGQTIRKEDLARTLEHLLQKEESVEESALELAGAAQQSGVKLGVVDIMKLVWKAWDPASAFTRSSEAVARGNLKVFAEIGGEFARFYAACLQDHTLDPGTIDRFCEDLRSGDPPDGQKYLCQAFKCYYQSLFEPQSKARIELLLFANILIGLHEQTRLQPEITEALNAPVIDPNEFARRLLKELHPGRGWLNDVIWFLMQLFNRSTHLQAAIDGFTDAVRRQAQHLITETMMTIELPNHIRLRLGDDLSASFPDELQQIDNPELRLLLAQIDPTPDSTYQSGAEYWGDLPDRLHFIADMFRCYQMAPELLNPPFSTEQTLVLKEGRLPPGRL